MEIFISELLGTFILVTVILMTNNVIYIALGFLAAIIIANFSKSHINPVITMIKSMQGIISNQEVFEYLAGQVTGAIIALILIKKMKV